MEAEERTNGTAGEVAENRSLLVLYGTETGKSQEIAQEIGRAADGLRFQTQVEEMNDVPLVSSHHHPAQSGIGVGESGSLTDPI